MDGPRDKVLPRDPLDECPDFPHLRAAVEQWGGVIDATPRVNIPPGQRAIRGVDLISPHIGRLAAQRELRRFQQHLMLSGSHFRFDDLYREISLTAGDQPAYTVVAGRRALVEMIRGVERLTRPSLNLLVERSPTSSERGASLGCGQAVKCFSRFISRSTG